MSTRDAGMPVAWAARIATGSIRANAPTLLMNADRTATVNVSAPIWITEFAGSLPIVPDNALMAPERCSDWLMIRTAAAVTTAASLNLANTLSADTMPVITATIRAAMAIMS